MLYSTQLKLKLKLELILAKILRIVRQYLMINTNAAIKGEYLLLYLHCTLAEIKRISLQPLTENL